MDVRRLRHSAIDDPALITAIQAAAAEAASARELEDLLRSRGWAVAIVERDELSSAGQPVLDISTARSCADPQKSRLDEPSAGERGPYPADLRDRLSPLEYAVTQEADTERPFTGVYWATTATASIAASCVTSPCSTRTPSSSQGPAGRASRMSSTPAASRRRPIGRSG